MAASLREQVAASLGELGLPTPTTVIQTMLMKNGFFVGWKVRYDGGHAVLRLADSTLELYDQQENSLKTVVLATDQAAA